jgi:hypothetical protein
MLLGSALTLFLLFSKYTGVVQRIQPNFLSDVFGYSFVKTLKLN